MITSGQKEDKLCMMNIDQIVETVVKHILKETAEERHKQNFIGHCLDDKPTAHKGPNSSISMYATWENKELSTILLLYHDSKLSLKFHLSIFVGAVHPPQLMTACFLS